MNFQEYQSCSRDEKAEYFIDSLSPSNRTAEYYVNWDKVIENHQVYEKELEELNKLIGKDNIKYETKQLLLEKPYLLKAIPILIAHRVGEKESLIIMELDEQFNRSFYELDFHSIDTQKIDEYMRFIEDVGLLSFLKNSRVKSLVDYVYGVEVGMDTNARKNRSGKAMESFIERKVRTACERLGYKYRMEMTAKKVREELGWNITTDRTNRRFDAVIYNENTRELYIIEANYYGASGTKPSAVTGEFTGLDDSLKNSKDKTTFIWVTDGLGWERVKQHLRNLLNM